jgi:hypothetical protein
MKPKEVSCPSCGAKTGEPCYTPVDNVDTQWDHDTRILRAMFTGIGARDPDVHDHRALTRRQAIVLRTLSGPSRTPMSARTLHTRSDLLWRLEERGLVHRNAHQQWRILPAGEQALDAYTREQVDRMMPVADPPAPSPDREDSR